MGLIVQGQITTIRTEYIQRKHLIHISSIFNLNFGLSGIEIRNVGFQTARSGGDEG
jgi:hypothetical protein